MNLHDFSVLMTAGVTIASLIVSMFIRRRIQTIHVQINSRMDELLKAAEMVAQAKGYSQGTADQIGRTDS